MPKEEVRLKMTWPWRLIGPTFIFLAVLFPILIVTQDQKPLDRQVLFNCGVLALGGIGCTVYNERYSVSLRPDGFTVHHVFSSKNVPWREVVHVGRHEKEVIFTLTNGKKVQLSLYFPHIGRVLGEAEAHLPQGIGTPR